MRLSQISFSMVSLSICIPTFNRHHEIAILLEKIVLFCKNKSINLEICISDNSDNILTEEIVKIHDCNPIKIRYQRNEKNIGFTANYLQVLNLAQNDYVLVIGDDDYYNFIEIENILKKLQINNPSLAVLGAKIEEITKSKVEHIRIFKEVGLFHTTFLGNLIFDRKFANQLVKSINETVYPHFNLFLLCIASGMKILYVQEKIVYENQNLRNWHRKQLVYSACDIFPLVCKHTNDISKTYRFKYYVMRLLTPSILKYILRKNWIKKENEWKHDKYLLRGNFELLKIYISFYLS